MRYGHGTDGEPKAWRRVPRPCWRRNMNSNIYLSVPCPYHTPLCLLGNISIYSFFEKLGFLATVGSPWLPSPQECSISPSRLCFYTVRRRCVSVKAVWCGFFQNPLTQPHQSAPPHEGPCGSWSSPALLCQLTLGVRGLGRGAS